MNALIVDDEPPARLRLRTLLQTHSDITVIGECGTADQAVTAIANDPPDLVLLDIQMPEGDGFTVSEMLAGTATAIIFVTAFSEHAARAFDVNAVDYLLKPFNRDRLQAALDKARLHLTHTRSARHLRRLPVDIGGRLRLIDLACVHYLRSERNYLRVHTADRSYLIRDTLNAIQSRLDPDRFLRVHRSVIVNLDHIHEIQILAHGELQLHLTDGTTLISSRASRTRLRAALGFPG